MGLWWTQHSATADIPHLAWELQYDKCSTSQNTDQTSWPVTLLLTTHIKGNSPPFPTSAGKQCRQPPKSVDFGEHKDGTKECFTHSCWPAFSFIWGVFPNWGQPLLTKFSILMDPVASGQYVEVPLGLWSWQLTSTGPSSSTVLIGGSSLTLWKSSLSREQSCVRGCNKPMLQHALVSPLRFRVKLHVSNTHLKYRQLWAWYEQAPSPSLLSQS